MRTKNQIRNVVAILVLLASPVLVMAQPDDVKGDGPDFERPKGNREGAGPKAGMFIPDLTEEQTQKIEAIELAKQKEILPISNQINEKEARLRTLQTADKVDMKAIYATIDEVSALRAQIAKKDAETHQAVRALLTDDQRVFFDTHFQRGPGGDHGPGGPGDRSGGSHKGRDHADKK